MLFFHSRFPWVTFLSPAQRYSKAWRGTPFEKEVSTKTVGELAELLRDANVTNDFVKRTIVEHTLNVRLADIQANATYVGVVSGLVGVILGAWLTSYFQQPQVVNCVYPAATSKQPEKEALNRPAPQTANAISKEPVKAKSDTKPAPEEASGEDKNSKKKPAHEP